MNCYKAVINFCVVYLVKANIIPKLAYKIKYIDQLNEILIMFFGNPRMRFFKISWLDCEF